MTLIMLQMSFDIISVFSHYLNQQSVKAHLLINNFFLVVFLHCVFGFLTKVINSMHLFSMCLFYMWHILDKIEQGKIQVAVGSFKRKN